MPLSMLPFISFFSPSSSNFMALQMRLWLVSESVEMTAPIRDKAPSLKSTQLKIEG